MKNPRRHHYCPQMYLDGFTSKTNGDPVLWVFDRAKSNVRKSKPTNEAHQRDYYKMELDDGSDPFALEKDFSVIESHSKEAILHILDTHTFPKKECMEYLVSFIGLLAVRTPSFRSKVGGFNEHVAKMVMDIACGDEKRFELTKKRLVEQGREVSNVSFADMREFIDGDRYSVETAQNEHLSSMLKSAAIITDCLLPRHWTIAVAQGGDFICSDNPVGLSWSKALPGPWQSPGFGMTETQVTVPLSREIGIIGTFEKPSLKVGGLNPTGIATFNNQAIMRCERWIYGPEQDFIWRDDQGKTENAASFFSRHSSNETLP